MREPDPRLLKVLEQLDEERMRRVKAERKAASLQAMFAKLKAQRTADAAKQQERATC